MSVDTPTLERLLLDALASEHGVRVPTSNVERLRQRLYAVRRTDERYASLRLTPSRYAPTEELWIVKDAPSQT